MAEAVVLDSWHGEHVLVGDVLSALGSLRKGFDFGATRTSVVNLVVVAESGADAETAGRAIAGLGGRHPGRTLLLVPGPVDGARVNAHVALLGASVAGHRVWSEQVTLTVCGPLTEHMDSLIEPFTLPDLPLVVWYVSGLPAADDPLVGDADVVLVDSKQLGDAGCFGAVAELAHDHVVIDLAWSRLRPWRELLAGLFSGGSSSAFSGYAERVTHAAVSGKEGVRQLLAGWIESRLGLPRSAISLTDARHVTMRLTAGSDTGPPASFTVVRQEGERVVRAAASIEGGPSYEDVLPLPDESLSWSLADALTHLQRDRVWEQSLRSAIAFAGPSAS